MIKFPVHNHDEIIDEYAQAAGKSLTEVTRGMLREILELGNDAYRQGWHDGYTTANCRTEASA